MKFADLRLAEPILRAVSAAGYVTATPIQAQAIPFALEGRDILAAPRRARARPQRSRCRSCNALPKALPRIPRRHLHKQHRTMDMTEAPPARIS